MQTLKIALLSLIILLPSSAIAAPNSIDLTDEHNWLPFKLLNVHSSKTRYVRNNGWTTSYLYFDLNGDGLDDPIRASKIGIHISETRMLETKELYQSNVPVEFVGLELCASIDGVWDIDNDGDLEIIATSSTSDGFKWRIIALDPPSGEIEKTFLLKGGIDNRKDGRWDGAYRVFGPIVADTPEGKRNALVVGARAGFDLQPRGVKVLDVETGEVLWTHLIGPVPLAKFIKLTDLDGDGEKEIILLGSGVSNLGDRQINGTTDDHAMVFVINADGSLRWSRLLGEAPASGLLEIMDLDLNGQKEVLVAAYHQELGKTGLAILNADGVTLCSTTIDVSPSGMVLTRDHDNIPFCYISFSSGKLCKYQVGIDSIRLEAEALSSGAINIGPIADLTDHPGNEVLMGQKNGVIWLLDCKRMSNCTYL